MMPARRPDLSWGLLAPSNSSRPAMHAVRMDALGRSVTTGLSAVCASCVCVLLVVPLSGFWCGIARCMSSKMKAPTVLLYAG